jgi:molybdate transport system substrate-binding protein
VAQFRIRDLVFRQLDAGKTVRSLLPDFERASGMKVATGSGSSQGTGPQTIGAQLARGVPADVVILSREGLNELITAKRIAAGTDVDLARARLGVAVVRGLRSLT